MIAEGPALTASSSLTSSTPPFNFELGEGLREWGDLRIDGFIAGKLVVISKSYSGKGVDHAFVNSCRTTRNSSPMEPTPPVSSFASTTNLAASVPLPPTPSPFTLEGPAELIGDNPFGLIGGTGAIWIRARETPAPITLTATHPILGPQTITLQLTPSEPETA